MMRNNLHSLILLSSALLFCFQGMALASSSSTNSDTPVALKLLKKEAQDDDPGAQLLYGIAYLNGNDGLKPDAKKAVYWLRRSARMGNAYAQLMLGKAFAEGKGVDQDLNHAIKWWYESANKGNAQAQFLLGKALLQGKPSKQTTNEAISWLEKSSDQNNKDAQYYLGKLYLEGYAIPKNETIAHDWLTRAAELGHSGAIELLTLLKESVDFTLKVYEQSSSELIKRAKDGDSQAEYELGIRYESGAWDVLKDNKKALKWITRAANSGNPIAMDTLADIYRHGDLGLAVDMKKAQFWDKKAALAKHSSSK